MEIRLLHGGAQRARAAGCLTDAVELRIGGILGRIDQKDQRRREERRPRLCGALLENDQVGSPAGAETHRKDRDHIVEQPGFHAGRRLQLPGRGRARRAKGCRGFRIRGRDRRDDGAARIDQRREPPLPVRDDQHVVPAASAECGHHRAGGRGKRAGERGRRSQPLLMGAHDRAHPRAPEPDARR